MNGINISGLNGAINRINGYSELINKDVKNIMSTINELQNLYSGYDLQFLFQDVVSQNKDVNKISLVIDNYSKTLVDIKNIYFVKDTNIKNKMNYMASKTDV